MSIKTALEKVLTNAVFPPHNIRRMNPNKLTSLIGQYPGKKTGDKIEDGN